MHKILNSANVLGTVSFFALIAVPAACEAEIYMTAAALMAVFTVCARLAIRELGLR